MASREFTDSSGVVWRVWDVTPAHLHPITRSEEYMEPYAGGWLAFECKFEKRRLVAPYWGRWHEYDLTQLEALLDAATPVRKKRPDTPSGERLAIIEQDVDAEERREHERTFQSPRGRTWTVRLHENPTDNGSADIVLRFTSGDSVVDLADWPADWKDSSREEFALLLLDAAPPRRMTPRDQPQRRLDDRPDEEGLETRV
jgi:hypothetical protein